MSRLADRLTQLPPYLFATIDAARERAKQKGLDTVSMGIGDPDRDPPEWIRALLCEEVMRSGNHRYPSYKGHPHLHEAALRYVERRFGVSGLGLPNVMTTIGSKEGIANLATALVNPGDVVLMPDPMYPVFGTMARLLGAETVALPVHPSTHYLPDPRAHLTPEQEARARVLFINYPHNPTGQLAPKAYLQGLVDYALAHDLRIVSDMAYGEIYYGDEHPASVLACDGALDCAIEMHSFSKSFNMTGWRVGFALGNAELIAALHQVKSNVDSGCFDAIQLAMARALDDARCDPFLDENRLHYKARQQRVCEALDGMGIRYAPAGGAIFLWCEIPQTTAWRQAPVPADSGSASVPLASSESLGPRAKGQVEEEGENSSGGSPATDLPGDKTVAPTGNQMIDSFAFCAALLDQTGLVASPGAGYGQHGEGFFRLSLSTPDEDIDRALGKLREFVGIQGFNP